MCKSGGCGSQSITNYARLQKKKKELPVAPEGFKYVWTRVNGATRPRLVPIDT